MSNNIILEACVETLEQAVAAENRGADRIELCSDLQVEGLTPSFSLVKVCLEKLNIPVMVMIRPRKGDFVYSEDEFLAMKKSINEFKSFNSSQLGFVFGILTSEGDVDVKRVKELTELANPYEVVFHRAIDYSNDLIKAIKDISTIEGVSRVLTSGGASTAMGGVANIKLMMKAARLNLTVMPGGGITYNNLAELIFITNAREYHGTRIVGKIQKEENQIFK